MNMVTSEVMQIAKLENLAVVPKGGVSGGYMVGFELNRVEEDRMGWGCYWPVK